MNNFTYDLKRRAYDGVTLLCFALFLIGCGGSNDEMVSAPVASTPTCPLASAWDGTQCVVFAIRTIERMSTPFVESGHAVTLEVVVYRPLSSGPYPALVFHHGSTGNGRDPSLFTQTIWNGAVAKEFAERGYLVLFPQRRGRGQSDGVYDEGFALDRSQGYSCQQSLALQGLEHALEDADAITQQVLLRTDVIPSRLLVGGVSRGGMLSIVHAARRPGVYQGVINFVGGWLSEGCGDALAVNRGSFAGASALTQPSVWLYGENDSFYSVAYSRANFNAFVAAGGTGDFHVYLRSQPGADGHGIANEPLLWHDDMWAYVNNVIR